MASDELTKMIDTLVETKTFGLDAIDGVKALRDKAANLEKQLVAAADAAKASSEAAVKRDQTIAALQTDLAAFNKREADLRAREIKMTDLEKTVAVEMAKAETIRSCMTQMLGNRTIRESIQTNVPTIIPPTYPGGSSTTQWATESKNVTREET